MSLSDRAGAKARAALSGTGLVLLLALAGCSVQPLYGNTGSISAPGASPGMGAELASISVVDTSRASSVPRVAQEVRNHLIFLFGGGQGPAADPRYRLETTVSASRTSAASIQRTTRDEEPTAAIVTVRVSYVLTETATGEQITRGRRTVTAPLDLPRQEFAALRAERNAEDRAAREAAELIRLAVAQEMGMTSRRTAGPAAELDDEQLRRFEEDGESLLQ